MEDSGRTTEDHYERIGVLVDRAANSYRVLASAASGPQPVESYCADPTARWVVEAALRGRALTVNGSTVRALETAVRQLGGARASDRGSGPLEI